MDFLEAGSGKAEGDGDFLAAARAAMNFSQSGTLGGSCPAGFLFCSDFSWPFNCRKAKGIRNCGVTKSVWTKKTAAIKTPTPAEKQCEPQARPTSSGGVRENECSALLRKIVVHQVPRGE